MRCALRIGVAHLDYNFFKKEAIEEENIFIISIDRLLWTRVCAMEVEKYRNDLVLLKDYYYKNYTIKNIIRKHLCTRNLIRR